jgi:hypothetical protein
MFPGVSGGILDAQSYSVRPSHLQKQLVYIVLPIDMSVGYTRLLRRPLWTSLISLRNGD